MDEAKSARSLAESVKSECRWFESYGGASADYNLAEIVAKLADAVLVLVDRLDGL